MKKRISNSLIGAFMVCAALSFNTVRFCLADGAIVPWGNVVTGRWLVCLDVVIPISSEDILPSLFVIPTPLQKLSSQEPSPFVVDQGAFLSVLRLIAITENCPNIRNCDN